MPTGTVIARNSDGSLTVRMDDGKTVNVPQSKVATAPEWHPADTKAPENAKYPKLGHGGYKAADFLMNLLPGAGATGGALLFSESGPGAIAGAAGGAVTGANAKHFAERALYKDLPDETTGQALKDMAVQGALGAATEGTAQGASAVLSRLIKPFRAAASATESGVRMTPGEASGSRLGKMGEGILEHMPGSSGTMESFRVGQQQDAMGMLEKTLDGLSQRHLSPEETGRVVQEAVDKAKADAFEEVSPKFDEARKLLGKQPGERLTPEEFDRLIEEHEKTGLVDAFGKPMKGSGEARRSLAEARSTFYQAKQSLNERIFGKIIGTQNPEVIGSYVQSAGLTDLRALQKILPPDVKQDVARNALQHLIGNAADAQTGTISARKLAEGLKKIGEPRARLIFGDQYQNVLDASSLLNRINSGAGEGVAGKMHVMRMLGSVSAALAPMVLGFSLHGVEGAAEGLGTEAGFSWLLSKAITNPKTAASALQVLRAAAVASARGIPYAADALLSSSPGKYVPLPEMTPDSVAGGMR